MFHDDNGAIEWVSSGQGYFLVNLVLIGITWTALLPRICGICPENRSVATSDILLPKLTGEDGGTSFIIYTTGFYFKSPTETEGFLVDLERERTCESGETTISIKKISLIIRLKVIYVPSIKDLSAYLQNGSSENERNEIVQTILSKALELTEVIACSDSEWGDSTEKVRANQNKIGALVLEQIQDMAFEYGFHIKHIIFSKCDYSVETQKKLDSLIESQAIQEMVERFVKIDGVEASVALEMATLISGNPNMKVTRSVNRYEISADANTLAAIDKIFDGLPPEVRARLAEEAMRRTNRGRRN